MFSQILRKRFPQNSYENRILHFQSKASMIPLSRTFLILTPLLQVHWPPGFSWLPAPSLLRNFGLAILKPYLEHSSPVQLKQLRTCSNLIRILFKSYQCILSSSIYFKQPWPLSLSTWHSLSSSPYHLAPSHKLNISCF